MIGHNVGFVEGANGFFAVDPVLSGLVTDWPIGSSIMVLSTIKASQPARL